MHSRDSTSWRNDRKSGDGSAHDSVRAAEERPNSLARQRHNTSSSRRHDEGTTHRLAAEELANSVPAKRKANDVEKQVVWPPVVIIENTMTGWDAEKRTWKGLENEEIRSFLKGVKNLEHGRVMALYGPRGHRGKSIVIFPATHLGFMDAQALSECLERDRRGRIDWLNVSQGLNPYHICGSERPGLVTGDGKKILYAYLATESDMLDADPKQKIVKRWAMESYTEKVLAPIKRIEKENEEAKTKREQLVEETKNKVLAVEQNRSEYGKVAEEFKKVKEEFQHHKKEEEDLEVKHRKNFEQRKKQYEEEKFRKVDEFRIREYEIRARLQKNKIAKETDVMQLEQVARDLKDGIDEEKKQHEVRIAQQKQEEVMELMKLDSILLRKREEKLALLDETFRKKQFELQEKHNSQIKMSREQIEAEREKLLQSQLQQLGTIEKEAKTAKDDTERMQQQAQNECICCFDEFGKEKMERALYEACGHANVCLDCAKGMWQKALKEKKKPMCPTCKAVQTKKFHSLPARIFS